MAKPGLRVAFAAHGRRSLLLALAVLLVPGALSFNAGLAPAAAQLWARGALLGTARAEPAGEPARRPALRAPEIRARSAYLLDAGSGEAVFAKFPDSRRAMASTTKVMTGLLAAESGRLDHIATVSRAAAVVGETTMGLVEGEQVSVRDLLYGLMMNSGNDAAIVLAEHLNGSVPAFVEQMNARAAELGLTNTRFANPHGLDHGWFASADHYASARDLAHLGAASFANAVLAEAAGTMLREVPAAPGRAPHRLRHTLSSLWWYPGTLGGKTGWTERAGQVRVAVAERAGTRLVAVVMHSPDHTAEVRNLFDYGFALSDKQEARTSVPVGAEAVPETEPRLRQAWETYKRLALTPDGRVKRGPEGAAATSDAQAAALLHAVWFRDRAAFDAIWGWTNLALSRRHPHPANPRRDRLFASRWSGGNVVDWSNSTAADQRLGAALLFAARLWNEPAYAHEAELVLDAVLDRAAVSWHVGGVPVAGFSIAAGNSFLKELDPVTTSGATLTPAFYRMFAEATRNAGWLWAVDGTYSALERAAGAGGPLGGDAGLLPSWFSVSPRDGSIGRPIDPSWQSTGLGPEAAPLAWQLALDGLWSGDRRGPALLRPTAQLLAQELGQRRRIASSYGRAGAPTAAAETAAYGALAGIALVDRAVEPALREKLDAALVSTDPDRILDAIDGLWLLAGGPPNFWRIWHPPADLPTTRNDAVSPPGGGYPWRYFDETGHVVHGRMLEHVQAAGGVQVFGLPRTDELVEDGRTVQYFQRARLVYNPETNEVTPAPLGLQAAVRRGVLARPEAAPVAPFESDDDRLFVPETGHSLRAGFRAFYERHGGAAVLGRPLTEELAEDGFTVQYFERAVLEYLPGKPVQASLLGDDLLREMGWLK